VWLRSVYHHDQRERVRLNQEYHDLTPELWDMSVAPSGHLRIQGCDIVELANRYGTPLYTVDRQRLERNYDNFYRSFNRFYPHVEIGYSYKTNPLPGAIKVLHERGASAEVISHFELWLALKLGVASEKIIYNGPAKTEDGLRLAISKGVQVINIDGAHEIEVIERLAREYNRRQNVGLRVITSVGWSSQFGMPINTGAAFAAFERLIKLPQLLPCSLHIHLGTGIKDVATYLQAIKEALEFSVVLRAKLGIAIRYLDFGGGFGVPTVRPYSETDTRLMANGLPPRVMNASECPSLEAYGQSIAELITRYYRLDGSDVPILVFEPGRALTSSAQSLLVRVLAIKPTARGIDNVIVDGGKNISLPLGYEYHEVFAASKANQHLDTTYNVFGPLCHPSDWLFRLKRFPRLDPGDVLAIMDAGAYFVPNQMNFSYPRPPAVLIENGTPRLVRRRESFENVVSLDEV
jgi:diaminopimelate decarboxylase